MRSPPDLTLHYSERQTKAAESQATSLARIAKELRKIREVLSRIWITAALWASGAIMTMSADQIAEIVVAVLRRGK